MGFEDRLFRSIDRRREQRQELSPSMQRAYRKAVEVLTDPENAIQESEFTSIYGEQQIREDRALVTRLRSKFDMNQTDFERHSKMIADTFEAILIEEAEMSEWLGLATTYKTSEFDDFTNKVDMLAEWQKPGEGTRVLALGVDVTFGRDSIGKKINQIKEEIDSGRLGSVKYFKDANGDFMGTRRNIPRTIIGVSQPVVEELANLWVNGEKKLLGAHPIQSVLAQQMGQQLDYMQAYAESIGKHAMAQSIQNTLVAVNEVRNDKKDMRIGDLADDPVVAEIQAQTREHFRV